MEDIVPKADEDLSTPYHPSVHLSTEANSSIENGTNKATNLGQSVCIRQQITIRILLVRHRLKLNHLKYLFHPYQDVLEKKKRAPAPLLAKCNQIVTTIKIGLIQINAISAIQKSKNRLKKCLYIVLIYILIHIDSTSY
jgi:hypothetical protein